MTFFRRLRRPVAVLLLVCMMSFFVLPVPSRALDPITIGAAMTVAAGAAIVYGRPLVMQYGPAVAARVGPWAAAAASQGRALMSRMGPFVSAGKDKLVGFARNTPVYMDKAWKWIKNHPGDAVEIGGALLDLIQALRDNNMPHTADALDKALNNKPSSSTDNLNPGDIYQDSKCGTLEVVNKETNMEMGCSLNPPQINDDCNIRIVAVYPNGKFCAGSAYKNYSVDRIYFRKIADPSPSDNQPIPDKLSPDQEGRLLEAIEKKLQEHKEEMERELDELLKKNLNDIDWPKFDNDAAKKYLNEQRGQQLQDKIDDLQVEIDRRKQERENCQQTGNCTNQCVDQCCEDSRLAGRLDQLKDRLEDLNQQEEDEAVQEYEQPEIPEPELKKIDFQPIADVKGELMTKFPFNMLQLIPSAFEVLTAEPTAPYWEANLGEMGGTHRVDFSVLDGLASFMRLVLTWLCYIGAVFCCLKIWSRF